MFSDLPCVYHHVWAKLFKIKALETQLTPPLPHASQQVWCSLDATQPSFSSKLATFLPKSSILVASDRMTFSQSSSRSAKCSLANLRQLYNCVSGVLGPLFGLGHRAVWSVSIGGGGQVSLTLITSSNRCHTGNKWRTEQPLQVCESHKYLFYRGIYQLIH